MLLSAVVLGVKQHHLLYKGDYAVLALSCLGLEMRANAQRDGRPAQYRWRLFFNVSKFG